MSMILTLISRTSKLSANYSPPIQLDSDSKYGLSLLSFHSFNNIPNIESGQKLYLYEDNDITKEKIIEFPVGAYEIQDIESFVRNRLNIPKTEQNSDEIFSLKPNNNTIRCELFSSKYSINFAPKDSIGSILGFSARIFESKTLHSSDLPVNIVKVRTIRLDSNITSGAYRNDTPAHTIYEFAASADPGWAIDEISKHLIYLPITERREISNITIDVRDQDFNHVNFLGEEIIVCLELKKLT